MRNKIRPVLIALITAVTSSTSSKENFDPVAMAEEASTSSVAAAEGPKTVRLSVIAKHKKMGAKSLNLLKEEVKKYASDHTFKETARKYGIHHSTVSGWVKKADRKRMGQRHLVAADDTASSVSEAAAAASDKALAEATRADEVGV